jgi:hypothetical protein
MTQTQRDAITGLGAADEGYFIFNTTNDTWYYRSATAWLPLTIFPLTGIEIEGLPSDVAITVASTEQDIDSYTLPTPGVWRVSVYATCEMNDPDTVTLKLTDSSNVELAKAVLKSSDTGQVIFPATLRRHVTTTTTDEIVKLRAISLTTTAKILSETNGGTKADWQRIDF